MEFRTATPVAEELQQLGYSLALDREVANESSRTGLPDEFVLQRRSEHAHQQGALAQWIVVFEGGFIGIIVTLDTGRSDPVMAFRVSMNALDLSEEQDVGHRPYRGGFASCNAGMIHACGHDGHTATGLGLVHTPKQFEFGLHGVIKLISQPAEEGTRGTWTMVDTSVVDDADYFTAVYTGTDVPADTVVCGSNNFMATTKSDAHFTGTIAHAGTKPEGSRNTLLVAVQVTLALHVIAPHNEGASRVNVGVTQAGNGRNVALASALLKVETRGANDVINQYVFDYVQQVIQGVATMYDVGVETRPIGAATTSSPPPRWIAWLQSQTAQVAGVNQAIGRAEAPTDSKGATLMMVRVQQHQGQTSYMVFGTQLVAGRRNEKFDFDEQVLTTTAEALARTVLNFPRARGI